MDKPIQRPVKIQQIKIKQGFAHKADGYDLNQVIEHLLQRIEALEDLILLGYISEVEDKNE